MHPPSLLASGTILPRRRRVKLLANSGPTISHAGNPPAVTVALLAATGLHWVLQLNGDIETVIEYDARRPGVELVKVDGRVVCREGTLWGYNGRFSFLLPGELKPVRADLEIGNCLWSAVTEFRLRLAGVTVFSCETSIDTCSLPVPAGSPPSNRAELPLPHA